MLEILNITRALSDETRVRVLMMLSGGELCLCQIIEILKLAPSTVSKHMSILRQAGLVETRKEGRWIYYRLTDSKNRPANEILKWLKKHLENDRKVLADVKQLRKTLKMSKDRLCLCYRS